MSESAELSLPEYKRYGRQMILRGFGLAGQLKLKNARVAVIGAGGLGCPTLQYLAGAGVGTIGIFDFDTVEESNLHRQVLHTTARVGEYKADSAKAALTALNPFVDIISHTTPLLPSTAIDQLRPYNLVLDCTDRPQTRYLVNDAAVRLGIPLVSGAAIEWAGQWCILGGWHQAGTPSISDPPGRTEWDEKKTEGRTRRPCYRCLFPQPLPRANSQAGTCEEEGVFGPIVGVVGVQMAAEAIKVILGVDDPGPKLNLISLAPCLTPDPASAATPFRSIRVRGPSPKCRACGPNADITDDLEAVGYDEFCGVTDTQEEEVELEKEGPGVERVSVERLRDEVYEGEREIGFINSLEAGEEQKGGRDPRKVLVDVRAEQEYGICALPGSINIPMEDFLKTPLETIDKIAPLDQMEVYFICRRGNDSLVSAKALAQAQKENGRSAQLRIKEVRGGVRAWSRTVDPRFPMY